jgi:hypothetical protein
MYCHRPNLHFRAVFANLLDVSSAVVVPKPDADLKMDDKNLYPCVFFDPFARKFISMTGVKIRLQDTFPNIRENRSLAWICADFAKFLFTKLDPNIIVKIVYRTSMSDLVTRIYSSDVDVLLDMGVVFSPESPERMKMHEEIVQHQMENFGEVCINDILQNYSAWVIESHRPQTGIYGSF